MIEAETRDEKGALAAPSRFASFFEPFVSLDVQCPNRRAGQARTLAWMSGTGLATCAAAPVAGLAGLGLGAVLAPLLLSGALLAGAFGLAACGGRLGPRRRSAAGAPAHGERPCLEQLLDGDLVRFELDGRLAAPAASLDALLGEETHAGLALVERLHVVDRVTFLSAFADLRRGVGAVRVALRIRRVSGEEGATERHVELRLAAVRAAEGQAVAVCGVARDCTAERLSAIDMARTLDKAKDASDAKSRFLASISHELRTPLNAIIGFTEILGQEYFGRLETQRQREYVGLIADSGAHLLEVVNGLLDISKIEAGRYELAQETFCVAQAMDAAAALVRPEAERKGIVLIVQAVQGDLAFTADRRAFHQILINLLSNAVKFTDRGSVHVSARLEGRAQIVEVEDTGIGIAPADLARIGEPFVRIADRGGTPRPGTGLGLSLVKALCELQGGALRMESRAGVGTTVAASLPVGGASRTTGDDTSQEKIVRLNDARKKTHAIPQAHARRRSA